jgi:DNA methylase/Protein of unknown function (DUF3102)
MHEAIAGPAFPVRSSNRVSELVQADQGIPVRHTPDEWAALIRADLAQAVAGFIAAGLHLIEAKADMDHGEWLPWVERELPIGVNMADRLMKIARHAVLANSDHGQNLPPSWQTLYELSRLTPPQLEHAIEIGEVHPKLERSEAKELVRRYREAELEDYAEAAAAALSREPSAAGPVPQPGEWWQLGPHLLYCGDSADPEFAKRTIGSAFVFADPPYNADAAGWDHGFQWGHDYLAEVAPVVAVTPGISAIADFFTVARMPYVWSMAAWITNGMTRGALGFGNWIYVALFAADSIHRTAQDHLKLTIDTATTALSDHKGRKPEQLLVRLLDLFTKPDETVADPFLGSGTTLFAADAMGRRCVGAEIDPRFCAQIIGRYPGGAVRVA